MKVYATTEDGSLALWFDDEEMTLNDNNTATPVVSEEEADSLAAEVLAVWE